jgi:hypothetical protein
MGSTLILFDWLHQPHLFLEESCYISTQLHKDQSEAQPFFKKVFFWVYFNLPFYRFLSFLFSWELNYNLTLHQPASPKKSALVNPFSPNNIR